MSIKLIAMDIDDTLIDSKMRISFRNHIAIRRAMKNGVHIALASGRPTKSMLDIAKKLGIEKDGYIISYNGASIIELSTGKTIYSSSLSEDMAHELIDLGKQHGVHLHTYRGDCIITEKDNHYTQIESQITGLVVEEVGSLKDSVNAGVVKVLMLERPERIKEVEAKLKPVLADRLSMCVTKPFFLEFMEHGTDKGSSLSILASHLKLKRDEVMAIGDSYNDIEMIKWAGVGVAMENANDDIKKHAKFVTLSNNKSGVSYAINKFVFKK